MDKKVKFQKKNTGFTLIELIVTIAVSAILLSAAAAGIVAWVHHADFVRNENYAETIYYAAQAELTRYRGNGQLAELETLVRKADADGKVMGKVPVESIADGCMETRADEYKDRLYYLKKDEGPTGDDNPLGGLLADYIYDGSIMDGAVCVEFDPADGTVYSVTYSDKNTAFTYDGAAGGKGFSLLDRTRETRKKNRVGYYNTELSEAAPNAVGKTKVAEAELINEEQLYFKWSLPERFDGIRKFLSYTIEIYHKNDVEKKPAYTFVLKGKDLKEIDASLHIKDETGEIDARYIVTGTGENAKKDAISHQFIAYSSGREMYLVLDSIDYGVLPEQITKRPLPSESGFQTENLKNSASILSLFSEPEDIYIRVQAQGKPYKTSAWRQSNVSNTLFAAMKEESVFPGAGADKTVYEIENARHLYNIRYRERENSLTGSAVKETCYRQTADIVWPADEDKLFHSKAAGTNMEMAALREADKCILEEKPEGAAKELCFLPIPFLGKNSRLEAVSGRNYEIQNFVLYQEETAGAADPAKETASQDMLGLVRINRGTIEGLTLTGMRVKGVKNVGAVCGVNEDGGKIRNTAVAGKVSGKENIGGMVGLDLSDTAIGSEPDEQELVKSSAYRNLANYAEVIAVDGKAGGIVGTLNEKGYAYRCENYGAIKGAETGTVYIGGITGYNKGVVQNCVSAPDDTPPRRQEDGGLEQAALKGVFVGGIAGCNNGGVIRDSGTSKETKHMSGTGGDAYVIGCRYVGGIVGYNNGTVSAGNKGTLINTAQDNTNKAKVIGHDYVGGIVGANGFLKDSVISEEITPQNKEAFLTCEIEDKYSSKMIVENWVNEGIVEAVGAYDADGRYAGGIAGYNAGDLKNCTTRINTSSGGASNLIDQVRLYGENASYVGGVAGYNLGRIYREDGTTSVNSVVSGKKYVGGIAGYNGTAKEAMDDSPLADSGKIENYELSGGYIFAGSYAGGYVGLNTTQKLLGTDGVHVLSANPNEVTADCFAGGVMGALILVPENNNDIIVNCATDNFFGSVKANYAFAGGYVGYTQALAAGKDPEKRAEELLGKAEEAFKMPAKQEKLQQMAQKILDERLDQQTDHKSAGFQFKYEKTAGESRIASVEAPVFAGGVIGVNSWNTKLLLQNIYNRVRVKADSSVMYDFISVAANHKEGVEKQDTFSFAGGIIGLVTPETEIVSCGNSGAGDVQGAGTYAGGIAEVNLGTIKKCEAASVSDKNYYGGIAGLNTNGGIVENCSLKGQISGKIYLGGIAACNESRIIGCIVESKTEGESAVIGTEGYVGGIAAVDRIKVKEDGSLYPNEIKNCTVGANIGISSVGDTVGGVLGSYLGGSLINITIAENRTVYGVNHVGGIAGEICADLEGTKENGIVNCANVNAIYEAGGIGGKLADGKNITGGRNEGNVASTDGMAGGIVPEILGNSSVKDSGHYGNVMAANEAAGGIAAKNGGAIESCTVENGGMGKSAKVTGKTAVGGIAGENYGNILHSNVAGDVAVNDVNAAGKNRAIGGAAGKNAGVIRNTNIQTKEGSGRPKIATLSQESYLGGIAGTNVSNGIKAEAGVVNNCSINAEVALSTGQMGTVGGAVGGNAGTVSEVNFSGSVKGTSGSQYGTGGIAGRNELAEAGITGSISACKLLAGGSVSAYSGDSGFGGYEDAVKGVYVGGICGFNPENGTISGCTLEGTSRVSGDYGYVGGITAYNLGTLQDNKPSNLESLKANREDLGSKETEPKIVKNAGKCVMGGITAYNGASGILTNCATGDWTVMNDIGEDQLYPTGGIIGCNKSIYDQKGLTNCAQVYGGWMTGGVIGLQITERRSGFTIGECENYGKITAKCRSAGGIISDWRNQSGKVRECINYGEVSIEYGDNNWLNNERNAAGGIIGTGWWGTPVSITIERCGNEGKISHDTRDTAKKYGKAAGIFGAYNAAAELNISISDCYNAAEIQNESDHSGRVISAGIFAGDESGGTIKGTITRCVNYGKGTANGKRFAGIASKNGAAWQVNVTECLNVGECYAAGGQWPIADSTPPEPASNYYFKTPSNGGRADGTVSRLAASHQDNNTFIGVESTDYETKTGYTTTFDAANNRLTLPALGNTSGRYLQFSNVGQTYDASKTGNTKQEQIIALKDAFSAYEYRENNGVDDKYALLVYGITNGTFNPPVSVKLEEADGGYTVTFEPDTDMIFCTAGYEIKIVGKRKDDGKEEIIKSGITISGTSVNSRHIAEGELFDEGHRRENYIELKASVRAEKINQDNYNGITAIRDPENGRYYSDWKDSEWLSSKPRLPAPVFHFEVTAGSASNNGEVSGYWVLDNAEDYKKLCGADWQVTLTLAGQTATLKENALRQEISYASNVPQNGKAFQTVRAEAEPTGDSAESFQKSVTVEKMLNLYPRNGTQKAEMVEKGQFIGTKTSELRYRFTLKQAAGNYEYLDITYMAEFWLGNEKLGESKVALPNQGQNAYCTIDLFEKKPGETEAEHQEKIRKVIENVSGGGTDVKICFYPWEIEDVKYYETDDATGKIVKRTVPEAVRTSGDTAFNSSYTVKLLENITGYKMYPTPQPKPEEEAEPETDGAGVITYTLYWDAEFKNGTLTEMSGEDYDGAEYVVTVTGKNEDTEIVLYQGTGDTENGKVRNKVTLQEDNWKYKQLILTVERLGKTGADSRHYIGASVTKEYKIPIRLNSIPRPTAKLRGRDSLVIDVGWMPSAEEGVGGYRIIMKGKDSIGKDVVIKTDVDGRDNSNAQIDLDEAAYAALQGAEEIVFSVTAVPRSEDGAKYIESRESEGYPVTIPERLDQPKEMPELMWGEEKVTVEKALEPEAFTQFALKLTDLTAPLEDAAYEAEYFIADNRATETGGLLETWDQTAGARPESDPEKGIYNSTSAVKMTGNLQAAVYLLNQSGGFNAEQAGRTLWYRVRAASNNKISSVWTGWEKRELPKALLKPVEIAEGQTVDREYTYTIEGADGTGTGDSHTLSVRQPKAGFAPAEFAKGYKIVTRGAARTEWVYNPATGKTEEKEVTPAEHTYILQKAEPAPDGTEPSRIFELTEGATVLDNAAGDAPDILQIETTGDETTYSYRLDSVTHSYEVKNSDKTFIYKIPMEMRLCYRVEDNTVQEIWLELPEGTALAEDNTEIGSRQFIATASADITVTAPDPDRYVVEQLTRWQRVADDKGEFIKIEIVKDAVAAAYGRMSVKGCYEETLYAEEMSERQLELFGLKRAAAGTLPEDEEESDKGTVSGNDRKPDKSAVSGNDQKSDKSPAAGGEADETERDAVW